MMKTNYQKGSTLYETLMYISLAMLVVAAIFALLYLTLGAERKNEAIRFVQNEGTNTLSLITSMVRNSTSITSPTAGNTASSLTVTYNGSSYVWSLNNGRVQYIQGSNPAVYVTSNEVTVSDLEFQNYSQTGTPGVITMQFTVSKQAGGNLSRYSNFEQEFRGGASARL